MDIATKLKENRKQTGFTQEEIAQKLHVSRQTVSNWETGKSIPDIYNLVELSNIYDISLDNLVKGDVKVMKQVKRDEKEKKLINLMIGFGVVGYVLLFVGVLGIHVWELSHVWDFIQGLGTGIAFATVLILSIVKIYYHFKNKKG